MPDAALREAVLNALVHRDYAMGAPVQVRVYADHLKIWNPVVLPDGWTVENLLGEHSSAPYNPGIANAFFRSGEIEAWGRGIQRIFAACQAAATPQPQLRHSGNDLWLEFPFSAEYMKAVGSGVPITGEVTDPVTDPVKQVVRMLANEALPPSAIQKALGLSHRPTFRQNYLRAAESVGLIERTLPDKPNSRLQKYRLTAKGRAWLAQSTSASP